MRSSRVVAFGVALFATALLIFLSVRGSLGPLEGVVAAPVNVVQSIVGGTTHRVGGLMNDLADYRRLRQRNADLEEALAIYQAELAQFREKAAAYDRLAALLDYDRFGPEDHQYVTCDVIGVDTAGFVNAIQINCGWRDGLELLDPVVTELGLVGRVVKLSATGAEVQLLTDPNSAVNARLQTTREDGVVRGQLTGDLVMSFLPLDAEVQEGDLVMTNGLGQTLPAGLVVGRVLSVAISENELYQEARVRSLVDFGRIEIVQVIINFEPVDLAVFKEATPAP